MNSTTETVGWVGEPDGRGTIGLIWSCFATIFLCTWSAVHPELPGLDDTSWKIFGRKLSYMALAIIAPEYSTANAYANLQHIKHIAHKVCEQFMRKVAVDVSILHPPSSKHIWNQ